MTDQVNLPPQGSLTLASILGEAIRREREYDWLGATEHYGMALQNLPESEFRELAVISEQLGYAVYRGARQAENVDEFTSRILKSIADYEKAKRVYERLDDPAESGRRLRCLSMISFLKGWLEPKPTEKTKLFGECWRIGKEALRAFKEAGMALEYGKLYNELSQVCLGWYSCLDCLLEPQMKIVRDACEYGEESISLLSKIGETNELAKAYAITATWMSYLRELVDLEERAGYDQKAQDYWTRAAELSQELAYIHFLINSSLATGADETILILEKSLEHSRKTRDRYLVGAKLEQLFPQTMAKARTLEDPDERFKLFSKALQYAQDARDQFSRASLIGLWIPWVDSPTASVYWELSFWETDLGKKRDFLAKALEAGPDLLKKAEDSGLLYVMGYGHDVLSKILVSLAKIEAGPDKKKTLLERALQERMEANRHYDQVFGQADPWSRGINQNWLAEIRSELSGLSKDPETRRNLLQEAIREKEAAWKNCTKESERFERTGNIAAFVRIALIQYEMGGLLSRLYNITRNPENIRKAADAFEQSAEYYKKPNLATRMAECYWKAAQTYDVASEPLKSSERFMLASKMYSTAADRTPQLREFYEDHALYMEAWVQIEKAKYYHGIEDYPSAKRYYESAAKLLMSKPRWAYLSPNYSAWAEIETAEDLSRNEKSEEAIVAFREAERLLTESTTSISASFAKIQDEDERQAAASSASVARHRQEYCKARAMLEEAKVLGKKGEHHACSERYGMAAETLEKIAGGIEPKQDRRELGLIATLSRAWQKMTQAEAEASPEIYLEASKLFGEARDSAPNERAKMLALGHSRFCKALEAGTRFADTRDLALYTVAVQHLETAADYYLKAGFSNASEYVKATKLLFEGYVYMDRAAKEQDHDKEARFYTMAEKVLQASAAAFVKADYPAKKAHVDKLLEKVREERGLALSLTEVLHAPSILSSTEAFAPPTSSHERALGPERFEHAEIQASLIAQRKSLNVGEDFELEIELVNAGRGLAQLVKLEQVIPEGFEVTGRPEVCRVEGSYLNMKGKQLGPLKTEELRLVLRPKTKGTYTLKPRILYLDESGKYKTHEPEPLEVTVKELGISGWVKGR